MKLRIKGDSLRLRVTKSEVERLLTSGRVEESTHFGPGEESILVYALEQSERVDTVTVRYQANAIVVFLPVAEARSWAKGDSVGIYAPVRAGERQLELAVEKDFACLDRRDEDSQDAFPNPKQTAQC